MSFCPAPHAANETERLMTLFAYEVLDTEPEAPFDELTQLAAKICETPTALISLIDRDRQWFKSHLGLNVTETRREVSFCSHAILRTEVMEVPDALEDERFAGNPLVTGAPKIRFYAGAPLLAANGCALGTICVIDYAPRRLSESQRQSLRTLARAVIAELELRKRMRQLGGALKERNAAQIGLKRGNEQLEAKVVQRTAKLNALNKALEAEIAARREAEAKVRELATHDGLTQLPNRLLLHDRLRQQLALAKRQGFLIALLFVDLDGFKSVNDTYGHYAGDLLLKEVSRRMLACVRDGDTVARIGGDEFVVSLYGLGLRSDAARVAKKLLSVLAQPWSFQGQTIAVSASIGIAFFPDHAGEACALIQCADTAMYQAKKEGKNAFVIARATRTE